MSKPPTTKTILLVVLAVTTVGVGLLLRGGSGEQAEKRLKQIRDKVRAIFNLGSGQVFSRRKPFHPWKRPAPNAS